MNTKTMLLPINLQLFAEIENVEEKVIEGAELDEEGFEGADHLSEELDEEDKGLTDGEELNVSNEYSDDEEKEEGEEEVEETVEDMDSKTKAIIREKNLNKDLKQKLKDAEEKLSAKEKADGIAKRTKELIDEDQIDEDVAKRKAEREYADSDQVRSLRKEVEDMKFLSLSTQYPDIMNHREEISYLSKRAGMTYEEIYLAKFNKISTAEKKTEAEQAVMHQAKKSVKKGGVAKKSTSKDKTILPDSDEAVYRQVVKDGIKISRAEYAGMHGININRR